ncbi:Domain of uncharacterised function (DUF2825) [Klebsiella pneumoniae]|nr:Domain of uncharacterised function (DUF2825) [Klebsiella pneumoniae]
MPVYPRWRGEHGCSSDISVRVGRFIPAGAGNTSRCRSCSGSGPVYPRWRGEHQRMFDGARVDRRFIPAGAGNTPGRDQPRRIPSVYPRWRGEHQAGPRRNRTRRGLSPLARGTLATVSNLRAHSRFIPAGAGNTPIARSIALNVAVYPRWRGEHNTSVNDTSAEYGLSPLARGTRAIRADYILHARFIPAGAGNTQSYSG